MISKYSFLIFTVVLLVNNYGIAQEFREELEGVVQSGGNEVVNIHVVNVTSGKATITQLNGYFSIEVKLRDTINFTAVQFKKKELVVTTAILKSKYIRIFLEEEITKLDEVVVAPHNLSGNLGSDLEGLKTIPIVTSSTLNLPNASIRVITQSERLLLEADRGRFLYFYGIGFAVNIHKVLNRLNGSTKGFKKRVARDNKDVEINEFKKFYVDSLFVNELKIPKKRITDFMYFCEADSIFLPMIDHSDKLQLWEFLFKKSKAYRKNNNLE
ncbi:MAG: hypothetical protein V3U92_09765 [Cellulophaga sp.]